MTAYDDLSPRARWYLENFSDLDLAVICADHEIRLAAPPDHDQDTTHHYLSTGCLHGEHAYCQSKTGLSGAKKPGVCKFCAAPCQCPCHTKET